MKIEVICLIAIAFLAVLAIGLITNVIVDPPFYRREKRLEFPWWDDKG